MFNRSRQLFATGMFAVDAVLIAGAWLGSYWLRFHGLGLPTPRGVPPLSLLFVLWAVFLAVCLVWWQRAGGSWAPALTLAGAAVLAVNSGTAPEAIRSGGWISVR